MPIFEVGQHVIINKPPQRILAFRTKVVAAASYNKLTSKVSAPYKVRKVTENTLPILGDGIEGTISIDCASKEPSLRDEPSTNDDIQKTMKLSQTQIDEANNRDNSLFLAGK